MHHTPVASSSLRRCWQALALIAFSLLPSCQSGPMPLGDAQLLPPGTLVEFWVYRDAKNEDGEEIGWQKSNIHVLSLPRPMSGKEARLWAEGVGRRDAGMRWTHYYVLATPPKPAYRPAHTYRSAVFPNRALPNEIIAARPGNTRNP
ncbi:MAG TPA: hypothetical protein DIT64_16925 [Verrucomicrobiales bacterium]|nr:hypothetical protein [Verrucomicrobiales bacterium]HCN75832.1 hypothetical protein [Verrucomicrobiales bacterium]HRJ10757.1 hypothetical protein [Prosthecobacter sp.]HRK16812.1 hypothetical protein [Prosthecobacter sp.]